MATQNETQSKNGLSDPIVGTSIVLGVVLTVVGLAGPALVGAEGELLIFGRNYLHDAVHLATGLGGLMAGYYAGGKYARSYTIGFGIVYFAVSVLGVVMFGTLQDLIALNTADNVLHLLLAVTLLGVGMIFAGEN